MSDGTWLTLSDFSRKYGFNPKTIKTAAKNGKIRTITMSYGVRYLDPGEDIGYRMEDAESFADDAYLLSTRDVGMMLGVSTRRIEQEARAGRIEHQPAIKGVSPRLFSVQGVKRYLSKRPRYTKVEKPDMLCKWAASKLGLVPRNRANYKTELMDELIVLIETIARLPEMERSASFHHLWQHFKRSGHYIAVPPMPRRTTSPPPSPAQDHPAAPGSDADTP